MRCCVPFGWLLLALTAVLTHASHYSRDESNEDSKTEFNLATTFKGGISTNRHHERAHLNSQLYPDLRQQSSGSVDIDEPSAHENGGSGFGTVDLRSSPYGNPQPQSNGYYPASPFPRQPQTVGYPTPPSSSPGCTRPVGGSEPNTVPNVCQPAARQADFPGYPANGNPQVVPLPGGNPPGVYPSYGNPQPGYPVQPAYPYPGQYLPQYPSYPPTAPLYPNYAPNVPVTTHPGAPPTSYQNQQNYAPHAAPGQRDRWDHSFKMKSEYTEDGVHKGPFSVLNNHGSQGYGSGFGGGYNGAFNRPGY
ncbi:calcium-binding protein P [Drosophila hydei]|uniref:Calcium-binding protein P n=1 Tax=Drosophila hydei TaxID=7224 RepID=A0A6J1LKK8_DROHY|nr:calcium-binding protein P [Drosophila hydei]